MFLLDIIFMSFGNPPTELKTERELGNLNELSQKLCFRFRETAINHFTVIL